MGELTKAITERFAASRERDSDRRRMARDQEGLARKTSIVGRQAEMACAGERTAVTENIGNSGCRDPSEGAKKPLKKTGKHARGEETKPAPKIDEGGRVCECRAVCKKWPVRRTREGRSFVVPQKVAKE